jgi:hypothetical protein
MTPGYYSILEYKKVKNNKWQLTAPLVYYTNVLKRDLIVPAGFRTDFSSHYLVPGGRKLFGRLVGAKWAVIHDYAAGVLVCKKECTRWQADSIMNEAMKVESISAIRRVPFMLGVRLFSWLKS